MSHADIARQRLRAQRLTGTPFDQPVDAIRGLVAVQAQDYHGAKWALAQRSSDRSGTTIDQALAEGTVIRTHVLRPTWHLVAAQDIRWLLDMTGPRVHAVNGYMYRQTGLDDDLLRRGRAVLVASLSDGQQLTRPELAQRLGEAGIAASGHRLAHLIMHAELDAVICSGAIRGKQHTYALLDERVPLTPPLDREEALARLARRFFNSHGPAVPQDLAWWSGLTIADVRRGLDIVGPELEIVTVDDTVFWFDPTVTEPSPDGPTVHLLPNFDEHLIAYKERRPTFDPARFDITPPATAFNGHVVVFDGQVVGGWRRTINGKRLSVDVALYVSPPDERRTALLDAAEQLRRFMGCSSVTVGIEAP